MQSHILKSLHGVCVTACLNSNDALGESLTIHVIFVAHHYLGTSLFGPFTSSFEHCYVVMLMHNCTCCEYWCCLAPEGSCTKWLLARLSVAITFCQQVTLHAFVKAICQPCGRLFILRPALTVVWVVEGYLLSDLGQGKLLVTVYRLHNSFWSPARSNLAAVGASWVGGEGKWAGSCHLNRNSEKEGSSNETPTKSVHHESERVSKC